MNQYLELLRDIRNNGTQRGDRTGTGTLSKFGTQTRYNLQDGFPLVTTKKMYWKGIVHELLWIISGDTNIKYLNDNGVHIWDAWADDNGDLGRIYGKQWRSWDVIKRVEPMFFPREEPRYFMVNEILEPNFDHNNSGLVGRSFESSSCGKFLVIEEIPHKPRRLFKIQFEDTGYIYPKLVTSPQIHSGQFRDAYAPKFLGVAAVGDISRFDDDIVNLLRETWKGIIKRCYDKNHMAYDSYGGRGVWVSHRWLILENFLEDVQHIENWHLKLDHPKKYSLDKDYKCSNMYGPDTCIWSSRREQNANTSSTYKITATTPDGISFDTVGIRTIANKFGLKAISIHNCLLGKQKHHKGWTFSRGDEDEAIFRLRSYDQLESVISSIRHDPNSRRHILNAWNVHDLYDMKLPPCHFNLQFYVRNGILDLQMYQRSADMFLGVPFNIASYSLLLMMVAKLTNLQPGVFIHTIGDAHIYLNHLDQVDEQLSREPLPLPQVEISGDQRTIDDFKYKDFRLVNYQRHPSIKAPIAV